ncbi:MAG: hypothetical protein PHQ50_05860 [Eubacteriales bacterium]|nr:hypothetical protein [Eubacteriales bacterium]
MTENNLFDRVALYVDAHYIENAMDFVCDEVTEHTQDDLDDPFTVLSESVSCRFELEGEEAESEDHRRAEKMVFILKGLERKLTLIEFEEYLREAGFHLSRSNKEDLVLSFCVQNNIHDTKEINRLLDDLSLPLLTLVM